LSARIVALIALSPSSAARLAVAVNSALPIPRGVDLSSAASTVLLRGCGPNSQTNADGVRCRADLALPGLLALPIEHRFDPALANPCSRAGGGCVPFFYVLGAFHGGVRDFFARLRAHPRRRPPPRVRRRRSRAEMCL
jgi:hypothetical protein